MHYAMHCVRNGRIVKDPSGSNETLKHIKIVTLLFALLLLQAAPPPGCIASGWLHGRVGSRYYRYQRWRRWRKAFISKMSQ